MADDERGIADLYTTHLAAEYDVRTAYDGEEAVELVDESVDILLLDRNMPGYSGADVVRHVRDRGIDCLVALITGFEPDNEILDAGFDDYLVKPVSAAELHETVERLAARFQYPPDLREYFALLSQQAAIDRSEEGSGGLINDELDADRAAQLDSKEDELASRVATLSEEALQDVFRTAVHRRLQRTPLQQHK